MFKRGVVKTEFRRRLGTAHPLRGTSAKCRAWRLHSSHIGYPSFERAMFCVLRRDAVAGSGNWACAVSRPGRVDHDRSLWFAVGRLVSGTDPGIASDS